MTFGQYVKDLREKSGLSLRQFCRLADVDASNWSKIERDLLPPPKSRQQLNDIASIVGIPKESEEWNTLFDLAAISHVPKELWSSPSVAEKMPMYFRTARGEKPDPETVKELTKLFRRNK